MCVPLAGETDFHTHTDIFYYYVSVSVSGSQGLKHTLLLQLLLEEKNPFVCFHTFSIQSRGAAPVCRACESAAVSCSRAGAAVCVCVSTDDSCMQPWFLFFFMRLFLFFLPSLRTTELAPEWCNKVVSTATRKRLTDSRRCQAGARTSTQKRQLPLRSSRSRVFL